MLSFEQQAFFLEKEKSYRQKIMKAFTEYGKLKCIPHDNLLLSLVAYESVDKTKYEYCVFIEVILYK